MIFWLASPAAAAAAAWENKKKTINSYDPNSFKKQKIIRKKY